MVQIKKSKSLAFFLIFLLSGTCWSQVPQANGVASLEGFEKKSQAKPPTEITAQKSASFDGKTQTAVFFGDVKVKDSQFNLSCDKLTAYLHNQSGQEPGESESEKGGLKRVIAEGNVLIIQERDGGKPNEIRRYVAKANKAEYDANTQELKLSGWPQVQEGINTHIATSESTVMYLSRSGKLRTEGLNKTVLQEQVSKKEPRP